MSKERREGEPRQFTPKDARQFDRLKLKTVSSAILIINDRTLGVSFGDILLQLYGAEPHFEYFDSFPHGQNFPPGVTELPGYLTGAKIKEYEAVKSGGLSLAFDNHRLVVARDWGFVRINRGL